LLLLAHIVSFPASIAAEAGEHDEALRRLGV
jgi:hypothetical protein